MDYSPKLKNKIKENEKMKALSTLNNLKKKDNNVEKEIKNDSLNNISLNLQNFISKALVNNSTKTKYFDINKEIEEIEKTKKNQLKEQESFSKLKARYNLGEQLLNLKNDENNLNNLIGLNNFRQKNFRKSSHNNLQTKINNQSNIISLKNLSNELYEEMNIDSKSKLNFKKRNSVMPFNRINFSNFNNLNHNNNNYTNLSYLNNNNLELTSPKSKLGKRLSLSQITFKKNVLSSIEKDLKNKKHHFHYIPPHSSKINLPIKKLSQNLHQITKPQLKMQNSEKNNKKIVRRKQRENSFIINKNNLYNRLMKKNDLKRNFNTTILKNNITSKYKRIKTYLPKSHYLEEINLSDDKKKDENDIRNILNLSKDQYKQFSKCCNEIKDRLLFSPYKPKRTKTKSSKNEKSNLSNKNEEKENKNTEIFLSIIEKKNYLEEGINENEIGNNKLFDFKKFKEMHYRHLTRVNKLVYDSLSDDESDIEYDDNFYINPRSKFKFFFDFFIFIITWYNMAFPPIDLCFYSQKKNYYTFRIFCMTIFTNLIYLSDLILGFLTAYYDIEERFINKLPNIIFNYLTSWFIPDLICALPYNLISIFRKDEIYVTSVNEYKGKNLLELFPLIKAFKIYKNNEFFFAYEHYIKKKTSLIRITETSRFILLFFICGHILACIFIFASHLENPSWVTQQNLSDSPKFEIYISSFYYVYATVFTVGYGDIVSINIYERFFNIILLIVGIMAYSYSVSSLSNYVQTVDSRTQDFNNKMAILQHLKLTHEKMPQSLYEKIVRFLKYSTHNEKDKNEIMDNLPIGLRTTLIMEMYKPIINNFIFFKTYSSSDFIIKVILAFRPILVMKNEKLVNEGDYIEEIVFVKRGSLSLELPLPVLLKDKDIENINIFNRRNTILNMQFTHYPLKTNITENYQKPKIIDFTNTLNAQKTFTFVKGKGLNYVNTINNNPIKKPIQEYVKIIEIRKNEHFGDILMFLNRRSPLSMKVKSKNAELFLLNKTDAVEISMSFPKIWSLIIKKSLFNMEQIERLINKALKFFFYQRQGKRKKGSFYQKDFTKENIFVNCDELYSSLSSQDCQLKSIPSVSENQYDTSDKNSIIPNFDKKNANQNITKSDRNSIESDNTFSNYNENTKSKRSFQSYSSEKSSDNNLKSNRTKIKKNKTKKKKDNENFSDILNNETIKEANSDDEKDSVIIKKNKKRDNSNSTEKKNVLTKKPTKGSKDYSDSDSEFISSSSSLEFKSKTESKTKRGKENYNYFDFSNFSNENNTLVYPFSKDDINNEEYPFENNNINTILENNNSIIKGFNGIVPKQYLYDNYLNHKSKLTNSIIKQKYSNHNFFFINLSTSKFDFQIKSNKKTNIEINIIPVKKEQIEFKIIQNESFTINYLNKETKVRNKFSNSKDIESKKIDYNKLDINYFKTNNIERKSMTNKSLKLKLNSEKKTGNLILNPRTRLFDSQKKLDVTNNEKKNMPLFSEGTLDLIGKNIERSSLALNNPKIFYRNYFNQVVHADNERNKTVTSKLKEIEKIIQNGQKSKRQNNVDINNSNNNNNNNKEIEVGEVNHFKLSDEDIKST